MKLSEAREVISQADKQFTLHASHARKLAATKNGREGARQYINELLPEPDAEASSRTWSIRDRKIDAVREALRSERNQLPSIRGSWWSLYSAISESIDHGRFFGFRGQGRDRFENKMVSVMNGQGADFKQKALTLALSMAG